MANIAKFTLKACGHVCAHFERSVVHGHYSNKDIDESKTQYNVNLAPERPGGQINYIRNLLSQVSHAKRKDLVCMCSVVVNAPSTLPVNMHDRFFRLTYDFLVDRYGSIAGFEIKEDIVVSCYRHIDESSDHIHFAFCPIKIDQTGRQRFIAKEVVCRNDLRTLHQDLSNYLSEHGCRADVINGKTQKDAFGRALSVREMKSRDISNRTHDRTRGRF